MKSARSAAGVAGTGGVPFSLRGSDAPGGRAKATVVGGRRVGRGRGTMKSAGWAA